MTSEERKKEIKKLARRIPVLVQVALDQTEDVVKTVEHLEGQGVKDFTAFALEGIHEQLDELVAHLETATTVSRGIVKLMEELKNDK